MVISYLTTIQHFKVYILTPLVLRTAGEVDSTGIVINPILQMRKVRCGGVNTGLCFSTGSAELGWDSCLAQCFFTTNFLVQTEMCRDSSSTLRRRVSVCLKQTRSRTVNSHLNARPRNGTSSEMETLLGCPRVCTYNKRSLSISVLSRSKILVLLEGYPLRSTN